MLSGGVIPPPERLRGGSITSSPHPHPEYATVNIHMKSFTNLTMTPRLRHETTTLPNSAQVKRYKQTSTDFLAVLIENKTFNKIKGKNSILLLYIKAQLFVF